MKKRRKRAIAKAEHKMDKYEAWKEHIQVVGGSLRKGKDGKVYGVLHVE